MSAVPDTHNRLITREELYRLSDAGPCELIVPVSSTSDRHGGIEVNVSTALVTFVRPRQLGYVRAGEVGIYTRDS